MPEPVIGGIKLTVFGPAFAGALIVNLRRRDRTWPEAVVSVLGGTMAGGLFAQAAVAHFSIPESAAGSVGFLLGYIGMAVCDTILDFVKDPKKIVAIWKRVHGDDKPQN